MSNPFLPLTEYIPDGEPHVFGDRVYLYGSHDKANSKRFCVQDYVVYSAPINDLSNWTFHGVSYRKEQDPRSKEGKLVDYYAPDCVRGNDGKYYLYYFASGQNTTPFGPLSVAVSNTPEGPFNYLGDIRNKKGEVILDFLTNDPAVINDKGRIYLYYGWGLGLDFRNRLLKPLYNLVLSKLCHRNKKIVKETKPSILSCAFVELEDDMLTVKDKPKAVLDSKTTAPFNSELYKHPFYEAPSIRKIGDLYYLVYSSNENNELAYATSKYPDRDFTFRGVIISNSDLGYKGNKIRKNNSSTIHGGIECINGQYYVFYHRATNNTDYSRQACAEPIEISEDGFIKQVEMTTQGMDKKPLPGKDLYSATLCCNLITKRRIRMGVGKQQTKPRITEQEGKPLLKDLTKGTKAIYKYFDLSNTKSLRLNYEGNGIVSVNDHVLNKDGRVFLTGNKKDIITIEILAGKIDIISFELE